MATALGVMAGLVASLFFSLLAAVALVGAGSDLGRSAAAGASAPPRHAGTGPDLNGDGFVSLAEAAGNADVVTKFARADRNRDGRLDPRELERLKTLSARPPAVEKKRQKARSASASRPAP